MSKMRLLSGGEVHHHPQSVTISLDGGLMFHLGYLLQDLARRGVPDDATLKIKGSCWEYYVQLIERKDDHIILVNDGSDGDYLRLGDLRYFDPSSWMSLCSVFGRDFQIRSWSIKRFSPDHTNLVIEINGDPGMRFNDG